MKLNLTAFKNKEFCQQGLSSNSDQLIMWVGGAGVMTTFIENVAVYYHQASVIRIVFGNSLFPEDNHKVYYNILT